MKSIDCEYCPCLLPTAVFSGRLCEPSVAGKGALGLCPALLSPLLALSQCIPPLSLRAVAGILSSPLPQGSGDPPSEDSDSDDEPAAPQPGAESVEALLSLFDAAPAPTAADAAESSTRPNRTVCSI